MRDSSIGRHLTLRAAEYQAGERLARYTVDDRLIVIAAVYSEARP